MAFAATAAHEQRRQFAEDLSEEFLYWACKQRDGFPSSAGTTVAAAFASLVDPGQAIELIWPYRSWDGARAAELRQPSAEAQLDARSRFCNSFHRLGDPYPDTMTSLDRGKIVVLVARVFDNWRRSSTGLIDLPLQDDRPIGLHAVAGVGYEVDGTDCRIIIRNSWGSSWGDSGYGYFSGTYFRAHVLSAWLLGDA